MEELSVKEALDLLAKKRPISEAAFKQWCDKGLVTFRLVKRGPYKLRRFKRSEIERIKSLLKDEGNGKPLIPKIIKTRSAR